MRAHLFIATVAGLLVSAAPAFAQTYPAEAVILLPVEVRSGPSMTAYATSKLNQNDKVLVLRESKGQPGWLEIMPPPGSFSWVNAKDVKQVDASQALVICDPTRPVPILPGSRLVDQRPDRESMKLTQGTIVVIVNRPLKVGDETFLPIQPHGNEVRYLPASAVRATTVVPTTNTPATWTLTPNGYTTNQMLADAEKARLAGDVATAQKLYTQVAQTSADPNQKQYALNILRTLPQGPYQPASRTVVSSTPQPPTATPSNLLMQSPAAWSQYGRLTDAKANADNGQPLYKLEDTQGRFLAYVTTNPGKSLVDYNNRMVSVYGPTMYRSDAVRMQYIVASHVAVP